MSDKRVTLTESEREALWAALNFYSDTLDLCTNHDEDKHGDEIDCEGWGPVGLADLESATGKVT